MLLEDTASRPNAPTTSSITGKLIVAMLFLAAIGAFYFFDLMAYISLDVLKANCDKLLAFTEEHYWSAVVLFILTYVAQTAFSLPGATLMTLTGGFLFGSLWAALYVNIGATTGATLAFLSARYLFRSWVEQRFGGRLAAFQEGFAQNAFNYLLTLRLIPLFPLFPCKPPLWIDESEGRNVRRGNGARHHSRQSGLHLCRSSAEHHQFPCRISFPSTAPRLHGAGPAVSDARGLSEVYSLFKT